MATKGKKSKNKPAAGSRKTLGKKVGKKSKPAEKSTSSTGKTLKDHATEFLRAANKGLPATARRTGIPLRPASQPEHVMRFNLAIQSLRQTKGLELDTLDCCDDSRPDDAPCVCQLPGDDGPTLHKKRDCCR